MVDSHFVALLKQKATKSILLDNSSAVPSLGSIRSRAHNGVSNESHTHALPNVIMRMNCYCIECIYKSEMSKQENVRIADTKVMSNQRSFGCYG